MPRLAGELIFTGNFDMLIYVWMAVAASQHSTTQGTIMLEMSGSANYFVRQETVAVPSETGMKPRRPTTVLCVTERARGGDTLRVFCLSEIWTSFDVSQSLASVNSNLMSTGASRHPAWDQSRT